LTETRIVSQAKEEFNEDNELDLTAAIDSVSFEEEEGPETEEEELTKIEELNDLRVLLQQATAQNAEEKRLKAARKRLVQIQKFNHPDQHQEQMDLLVEINNLEEKRVWHTVGCIALFYTQLCAVCKSKHDFFQGWFTVRTHATDKHLRDLKAGEPNEPLPRWVEVTDRGIVPVCANCCELRIAAEVGLGNWPEAGA
jgi:hypothetical protein